MKQKKPFKGLLVAILLLCSLYASAYDFSAENEEGVTIYYNIISSSAKTVEVTYGGAQRNATDSYVGDIVIPETTTYLDNTYSVAAIGDWAFYYCSRLTSFTLGNNVIEIGEYAFTYCSALTEIIIPDGVTTIGKTAFSDCTGLTSVTIGNSVTSIGNTAFSYCRGLKSIYSLNPEPPECGSSVFYEVDRDECVLYVPIGSYDAYATATRWSAFNNIVEMDFVIWNLYNVLLDDIENVQENLDLSWDVITTDYSDVADEFESEYDSLVEELKNLLEELEEAYNNGTLDDELADEIRARLEEITPQIEELLEDAENAHDELDGIESVSIDNAEVSSYYTIDGKAVDAPKRGVNIVKYSDGSVKKVYVK